MVATHVEEDVFLMFGVPKYIICDNGSEFTGGPFSKLAQNYGVKILFNANRHPQANPAERVNRDIVAMLRAYVGENHRTWDTFIPKIAFALHTRFHETTAHSPAFLNFGRELSVTGAGFDMLQDGDVPELEDYHQYGSKLMELKSIHQEVAARLKEAHDRNAQRYNLRRRPLAFKANDLVLKRNFPQSDATKFFAAKLAPRYVGPFVVAKKTSPLVYTLKDRTGKNIGDWHVTDLKPYVE